HAAPGRRVADLREPNRDAADRVACGIELLASIIEPAAERPATNVGGDVEGAIRGADGHAEADRIELVRNDRQLARLRAEHQSLSVADEHIDGTVVLDDGVD